VQTILISKAKLSPSREILFVGSQIKIISFAKIAVMFDNLERKKTVAQNDENLKRLIFS
jgi:hypothetical protein